MTKKPSFKATEKTFIARKHMCLPKKGRRGESTSHVTPQCLLRLFLLLGFGACTHTYPVCVSSHQGPGFKPQSANNRDEIFFFAFRLDFQASLGNSQWSSVLATVSRPLIPQERFMTSVPLVWGVPVAMMVASMECHIHALVLV